MCPLAQATWRGKDSSTGLSVAVPEAVDFMTEVWVDEEAFLDVKGTKFGEDAT